MISDKERPETATVQKAASVGAKKKDEPSPPMPPEEQMALYEESLKESDWGHQPC